MSTSHGPSGFTPRVSVTVEFAPGKEHTVSNGDVVTYVGPMTGWHDRALTVRAMTPEGLLSLVDAAGRMIAQIPPQTVRLAA